jgi:hypothetical protein
VRSDAGALGGAPQIEPSEARLRRICLWVAFLLGPPALLFFYAKLTFAGLIHPEALDFAQLGRNLSAGRGFMTDVIRPLSLIHGTDPLRQPEVVHGPLFPLFLALAFGAVGAKDWAVLLVTGFFFLATLPLVYHLGRRVFTPQIGVLAVVILAINGRMLQFFTSGTHVTLYLFLLTAQLTALYGLAAEVRERDPKVASRLPRGRLILIGALAAGLYLTDPVFIWVLPVALVTVGVIEKKRWIPAVGIPLVAFAALAGGWMIRSGSLTGNPIFGLAGHEVFMNTGLYPGDVGYRMLPGEMTPGPEMFDDFMKKVGGGFGDILETLPGLTASWLLLFFIPSLFFRFSDVAANRLRGAVVATFGALLVGTLALRPQMALFVALVPVLLIFSLAFLMHLGRQAKLSRNSWIAATALLSIALGYPLVKDLALTPHGEGLAYGEYAQAFAPMTQSREVVLSDQPQTVAWNAGTPCVWLPASDGKVPDVVHYFPSAKWLFLTGEARGVSRGWRSVFDGFAEGIYQREALRASKKPFPDKVRINATGDPMLDAVNGSTWVPLGEKTTLEVIVASLPPHGATAGMTGPAIPQP